MAESYATPYYLTLFIYNCSLSVSSRLWDLLWSSFILLNKFEYTFNNLVKLFFIEYLNFKFSKNHKKFKRKKQNYYFDNIDNINKLLRNFSLQSYEMNIIQ